MEKSFENRLEDDATLSQQQRRLFYEEMKHVVVIIQTPIPSESIPSESIPSSSRSSFRGESTYVCEEDESESGQFMMSGTGVILDRDGLILTCAHCIPDDPEIITLRRVDENLFWTASVVHVNKSYDLCLLRVDRQKKDVVNFDFTKFGDFIDVGMDVLTICHTDDLFYTLVIGEVAFECGSDDVGEGDESPRSKTPKCRKVGHIIRPKIDVALLGYHRQLRVIQINNFHCGPGASGAPVFDSRGRVIGILSFILKNFDFAIPFSICRGFFQDYLAHRPTTRMHSDKRNRKRNMKRKREFGDDRRKRKKQGPFLHGDKGGKRSRRYQGVERASHGEEYLQSRDGRLSFEPGESFSRRDSILHHVSTEGNNLDRSQGDKGVEPSEVLLIGFPSFLSVDEMSLRCAFASFGEIEKVTAFPGRSYAFVQFRIVEAACRAKEALQGKLFDNPCVSICFAKSEHGSTEHGKKTMNASFLPHIKPNDHPSPGGPVVRDFHQERNLAGSSSDFNAMPRFISFSEMPRDLGSLSFGRNNSLSTSAGGIFEQARMQGLGFDRGFSEDIYECHKSGPGVDSGALRHEFQPERPPQRSPLSEDSWDLPDDVFPLREAKKLKTGPFPDKELPEYPFSDFQQEKQHAGLPKVFPNLPEQESFGNFESGPYDFEWNLDYLKKKSLSLAERDDPWKTHDSFEAGPVPLPIKPVNLQRFSHELHRSPLKEEWKWEGTIAKGGTPVCRAPCFPVGKVLDVMLPEMLNCTARTGRAFVPHMSNIELESGRPARQGNEQLQNSTRGEAEADPKKRLQATLQLASALLQQIQQQAKTSDQK